MTCVPSYLRQVVGALFAIAVASPSGAAAQARVLVRGTVVDSAARVPIPGAHVEIPGTRFAGRTTDDGSFTLGRVPPGEYALRIVRLGYSPATIERLEVPASDSVIVISAALVPAAVPLSAIVVTPGFYGVMQAGLTPGHTLSRTQIETAPQLGEDLYRSVGRLPGVTSIDMSARFSVRGASGEELYSTLDGLELHEPFHLKDIDAALSIIDVNSIAGVELGTGGFAAEYGNRLTGVFTMHSIEPRTDRTHTALSLSILNARYMGQGGAANGRFGWLVSARRGYLDIALDLVGSTDSLKPAYYDYFAKAYYDLPRFGRVTLHTLYAADRLNYFDGPDEHLSSKYGTSYVWATWAGDVTQRLEQRTVLSTARLRWTRLGDLHDGTVQAMALDDRRAYDALALRQDWQLDVSGGLLLKAGVEGKTMRMNYDYDNWIRRQFVQNQALAERFDTVTVTLRPTGSAVGAYVSQRMRLMRSLTAEAGVRYDVATYSDDSDVSPRFNVAWEPTASTTIRGAWGTYSQPQPIHGLQVSDSVTAFAPSERAEHLGLGVEQSLPRSMTLRLELYDRRLSRSRAKFVNREGFIEVFPEIEEDRLRLDPTGGRARGIEGRLQSSGRGKTDWSAGYTLSSVTDRVGARDVPRSVDQRHGASADWAFRPTSNKWRYSVAWVWHSGWPITPQTFTVDTLPGPPQRIWITTVYGEYASARLPEYHRLDMRFTRFFDTRRGRVSLYADIWNVFDSPNARGYDYNIRFNPYRVIRGYETQLPRLPSIGMSWEF